MLDPTAAYRTSQVVGASRAGQIVLLYQGAIRFGTQHLAYLERHEIEPAHSASIRCQEIVLALRSSLALSYGPIAVQLDQLYDFVLRHLVAGNVAKEPRPTEEALQVLRGLLEAWQELASRPSSALADESSGAPTAALNASLAVPSMASRGPFLSAGARR
jgi:flagellar protein FliS